MSRQHFVSADGSHYVGENDDDTVSDTTEDSGSIEATHDAIRLFISDEKKTTIDNNEGCEKISPTNSNAVNESALVAVKCAICLEQYEVGDELTYSCNTSCSHCYHQHCIADWIVQQWGKGKQGRRVASSANGEHINSKWQIVECPVCRQLFTKIEKGNLLIRSGENGIATHVPAVWQNRENVDIGNTANSSIETTATESTAEIDAEIGVGR